MALDKVVDSAQLDGAMAATADAIRGKTGKTAAISWDVEKGFADAVSGITAGDGSMPSVQPKEVNFYDYDGTLVYAYTVAEAHALTELPPGPAHDGLVFQGWNWSLESVKSLTHPMNIGAMYITDDGKTRLYITLQEGRTSPMMGVGVNGTVTVDWGDDTEPDILTNSNINTVQWTPTHHYAAPGNYVIRLTVDGQMLFSGSYNAYENAWVLRHTKTADERNSAYLSSITRVEIGSNVSRLGPNAFSQCLSITTLSMPNSLTSIGGYAFTSCIDLSYITIPHGVKTMPDSCFSGDYSFKQITLPESVTALTGGSFRNCQLLNNIQLPAGINSIGTFVFQNCRRMASMRIPNGLKTISANTFSGCSSMRTYDFSTCESIPTLDNTNVFTSIPDDCEIRVPVALYDEWIAAANWTTYADYIKAY